MVSSPGKPGGGLSESFSSSVCGATRKKKLNTSKNRATINFHAELCVQDLRVKCYQL